MKNLRECSSLQANGGHHHHEALFRQLQHLALEKENLKCKMQDWESAFRALREVESALGAVLKSSLIT